MPQAFEVQQGAMAVPGFTEQSNAVASVSPAIKISDMRLGQSAAPTPPPKKEIHELATLKALQSRGTGTPPESGATALARWRGARWCEAAPPC